MVHTEEAALRQPYAGRVEGTATTAWSDHSVLLAGQSNPAVCVVRGGAGTKIHIVAHCTKAVANGDHQFMSAERRDPTITFGHKANVSQG